MLFGFYPADKNYGNYWDWTTLVLRKVLLEMRNPEYEVLDIGTGPYGVLAYFAKIKLRYGKVTGVDYLPELVINAQKQVPSAAVCLLTSDLFESVDSTYNIIIFNAPYINTDRDNETGILKTQLDKMRWSGGKEGIETIVLFLSEVHRYLKPGGCVLLGVNLFHIKFEVVRKMIKQADLIILKIYKNRLTLGCVLVITPKLNDGLVHYEM